MKKALVTGVTGQDGSYLAEFLLERDYKVYGITRRHATDNNLNIRGIIDHKNFELIHCDLTAASNVIDVIEHTYPREVYNLAAQSDVRISFDMPEHTMAVNAVGVTNILEAMMKYVGDEPKFYQASTSEMFGKVKETPQKETTPFHPRSPYGVSKIAAYWMTVNYRESYNLFACNGILFNHESPRRGKNFVTRKVINGLKRIKEGKQQYLEMGNIDSKRDWGHAKDYVEAMYLMLQQDKPDDYVIATGEQHTVRELIELAGQFYGMDIVWDGEGEDEIGIDRKTNHEIFKINPQFYRPAEVDTLLGDPTKAKTKLNWKPKYTFEKLVEHMCICETGE